MSFLDGLKKLGTRNQPDPAESGTGPATKCERQSCGELLMKKTLKDNLYVCPVCGYHHRLSAHNRIEITLDQDSFVEMDSDLASVDPLNFTGAKSYTDKLVQSIKDTKMLSAMLSGTGTIDGITTAFGVTDSDFIMGSMDSVVGEKFTRLTEYAIKHGLPLVTVSGSGGGARMYEGLYSLMQMAKTSAALGKLKDAGLPYISVVADATMAGVWASWAALGDIILAEPEALVGFTGARVIKTTINCELPDGFQLSEFLLEHGQIDNIVHRRDLRNTLASLLNLMMEKK